MFLRCKSIRSAINQSKTVQFCCCNSEDIPSCLFFFKNNSYRPNVGRRIQFRYHLAKTTYVSSAWLFIGDSMPDVNVNNVPDWGVGQRGSQ